MTEVVKGSVGAVIPVRSRATRLPNKPLLDVAGKTALQRVASQASRCASVRSVIVATTTDPEDDALAQHAESLGLAVFRGSRLDVLRRLADAAAGLDTVVEVDGDDLLCSHEYMERGVALLRQQAADMVRFEALPVGATPTILSGRALQRAVARKPYHDTETGFFRFIEEDASFKVLKPRGDAEHAHATARMTLDYPEDLEFFRAVWRRLDELGDWCLADLLALLRQEPELVAINQDLDRAYQAHFDAEVRRQKETAS